MAITVVIGIGLLFLLSLAVLAFFLSLNRINAERNSALDYDADPVSLTMGEKMMIRDLVQQGQKIAAIKRYRLLTGCDLKTAKEQVERLVGQF
ncbi:hypothetical protein RIF25_06175 [Thermosynechococcaceae cyanobacterium BACA0444]|uniref:Ribosomal protein L7/L12 C-terminal domain-containing protein n=1 Tax=Pseudocalidococcus azoricus BACA0444 TaxID=2918990 RepID=A0AAE4FRU9_9CYAN|nr:hypothetical protein [Pseudocalidococcus azoricus]MDS3860392.1 hypothetical protein [Pseudocalidococcus azoricus BACA0444]